MSDTYVEARNKQEMLRAVSAVPYSPGCIHKVVNVRRDGGRTTYTFDNRAPSTTVRKGVPRLTEDLFYARKKITLANIRRSPARVWK